MRPDQELFSTTLFYCFISLYTQMQFVRPYMCTNIFIYLYVLAYYIFIYALHLVHFLRRSIIKTQRGVHIRMFYKLMQLCRTESFLNTFVGKCLPFVSVVIHISIFQYIHGHRRCYQKHFYIHRNQHLCQCMDFYTSV